MKIWKVTRKISKYSWESWLDAVWEVSLDPMSDQFTPESKTAAELLDLWSEQVGSLYPDGLIPIRWYVRGEGQFEYMPFQYEIEEDPREDFLTYNTWPVEAINGERLNWFELPVVDKFWQPGRSDKGALFSRLPGGNQRSFSRSCTFQHFCWLRPSPTESDSNSATDSWSAAKGQNRYQLHRPFFAPLTEESDHARSR